MKESELIELSVKAALGNKNGNAQRKLSCAIAKQFSLKDSETSLFSELWKVYKTAAGTEEAHDAALEDEVANAVQLAINTAAGQKASAYGHSRVTTRNLSGDCVIFSDHHMSHTGCRQNFFHDAKNDRLYSEVLEQYFDKGFTLIENGDVEELVIDEQSLTTAKKRAAMSFENSRRSESPAAQRPWPKSSRIIASSTIKSKTPLASRTASSATGQSRPAFAKRHNLQGKQNRPTLMRRSHLITSYSKAPTLRAQSMSSVTGISSIRFPTQNLPRA